MSNKVEVQFFSRYEFSREEADRFLATAPGERASLLNDMLDGRHPLHEEDEFNVHKFREEIGKAMVNWREKELKMLPEIVAEEVQ